MIQPNKPSGACAIVRELLRFEETCLLASNEIDKENDQASSQVGQRRKPRRLDPGESPAGGPEMKQEGFQR
jgi:hypothetical protein